MVLIDTSSWIEALRKRGKEEVRERVNQLLMDGEAVACHLIWLELWNGAQGQKEKNRLREIQQTIPTVKTTAETWETACELARKCRTSGCTVPATDLLIVACALTHGIQIEHCDSHFEQVLIHA